MTESQAQNAKITPVS